MALHQCSVDPEKYNGHSFRIVAVSTAAARGIPETTIKMLGRWQSAAYTLYIRTPRAELASIMSRLHGCMRGNPCDHLVRVYTTLP